MGDTLTTIDPPAATEITKPSPVPDEPTQLLLKQGDILLYKPMGFSWKHPMGWVFGQLISAKTWHRVSHVEIYDGNENSLASRDGQGVGRYNFRRSELTYVLRPTVKLDFTAGEKWFDTMKGTPYGWLDLAVFVGVPIDKAGIVCSPFAAAYLRACGWDVFPADPINKIAPFQFLDLTCSECVIVYGPAV